MTQATPAQDRTRSAIRQSYDNSLLRADLDGLAELLHSDVVVHDPASLS